jgi:hypothetical protein
MLGTLPDSILEGIAKDEKDLAEIEERADADRP